jgi:hypothetical protein
VPRYRTSIREQWSKRAGVISHTKKARARKTQNCLFTVTQWLPESQTPYSYPFISQSKKWQVFIQVIMPLFFFVFKEEKDLQKPQWCFLRSHWLVLGHMYLQRSWEIDYISCVYFLWDGGYINRKQKEQLLGGTQERCCLRTVSPVNSHWLNFVYHHLFCKLIPHPIFLLEISIGIRRWDKEFGSRKTIWGHEEGPG